MAAKRGKLGPNAVLTTSSPSISSAESRCAFCEKGRSISSPDRAHSRCKFVCVGSVHCARNKMSHGDCGGGMQWRHSKLGPRHRHNIQEQQRKVGNGTDLRARQSQKSRRRTVPAASAVTICADNKLSMDIPYFRMSQPTPPPSARPPIPVLDTIPYGTASPKTCVSLSMSPRVAPPCTRTVRVLSSTKTDLIRERSITKPSSQSARPPTLCPPPRIAVTRLFARPKWTAAITSATPEHRAITFGCLLTLAFQI